MERDNRLADRNIALMLTDKAREFLAERGFDPAYAARPLKRLIQKEIQDQLARSTYPRRAPLLSHEKEATTVLHCASCSHVIGSEKVCSCGTATPNMSFAERTEYEVQQWKAYKARAVASV